MMFKMVQSGEEVDWQVMKPEIFATIMDFFASQQPVMTGEEELSVEDTGTGRIGGGRSE